jgi:hypothetical protein
MLDWGARFLQAFIPLFVAIDPIGLAAIFLGMGTNIRSDQRRRLADQAIWSPSDSCFSDNPSSRRSALRSLTSKSPVD